MSNSGIFEEPFKVRYYDVDAQGYIKPSAIFRMFQEAGGEHHTYVSDDLIKLYQQGMSWVLAYVRFDINKTPRYGQHLTVRTWISSIENIKATREYVLVDENGQTLVRSRKLWVFVDARRKRPIQIPDWYRSRWQIIDKHVTEFDWDLKNFNQATTVEEIVVRKADLDINNHVNNIMYIQWLQEVKPQQFANLLIKSLEAKFISEAGYRDKLQILCQSAPENNACYFRIYNTNSGRDCLWAKIHWEKV